MSGVTEVTDVTELTDGNVATAEDSPSQAPERPNGGRHRAGKGPSKPASKAPSKPASTSAQKAAPEREISPEAESEAKSRPQRRSRERRASVPVRTGSLVVLLVLAIACAATAFLLQANRPDPAKQVETARKQASVAAAHDIKDILSYSYLTINADINRAKSEATGQFLTDYTSTAKKVLAEAAAVKAEVSANVDAQAVVHAQRNRVTLLMYVDQDTVRLLAGQKTPSTRIDPYRVQLTMSLVKGHWLVSDLQPL